MSIKSLLPTYNPIDSSGSYKYKFTVFTPVYNRANTLHRVFESLNNQTFKDFELLIINDGSKDDSHNGILKLIKSANFSVNYVNNKNNRHKMACLVQGIKLAQGEFFLTFDSDDECEENALQVFNDAFNKIPKSKKVNISGITCQCKDQFGVLVGEKFHEDPLYSSSIKNILKGKYLNEKWGFVKTDVLKGITVNEEIFSKGYIPEGTLWILLSKYKFETVYINNILRTYYMDTENRITNNNHDKNAYGMMVYSLATINWFHKDYLFSDPKIFIKRIYTLLRAARYLGFGLSNYTKAIDSKILKTLFFIGWPFKRILN